MLRILSLLLAALALLALQVAASLPGTPLGGAVQACTTDRTAWQWAATMVAREGAPFSLSEEADASQALACVLALVRRAEAARKSPPAGVSKQDANLALAAAWTTLAAVHEASGAHESAQESLSEARKLAGPINGHVGSWHSLGPFSIGKTELDGDPLEGTGGIRAAERSHALGNASAVAYPSEMVDGGSVRWREIRSAGPRVELSFPGVRWNDIVQSISMAAVEAQAWVVGHLFVSKASRYSVHCKGVGIVQVDDETLAADQYHTEHVVASVHLAPGVHAVRLRVRVKAQVQFSCQFAAVVEKAALRIFAPRFLPDLVDLELLSPLLPVPVLNLGGYLLRELTFSTPKGNPFTVHAEQPHHGLNSVGSLAPGQITYVPLRLQASGKLTRCPNAFKLTLTALVVGEDGEETKLVSNALSLQLRCRKAFGESFLISFLDLDGSVAQAGVVPPSKPCTVPEGSLASSCPILVASHGNGVTAGGMADAFKFMKKGDKTYTFGVRGGWVLSPARHGAHNHQGIGAGTVDAAIAALHALSSSPEGSPYLDRVADPARILSVGHSMGGHGSWLWSSHHPDRLLGAAPSAGWISKEFYGDSNRLYEHDQSVSFSDASLQGLMRASITEENVDNYAANLVGVPTLVRVGQEDKTVHPWDSRKMVRLISEWNARSFPPDEARALATLNEVPKMEHWWWDTKVANDGGVLNDPTMRRFYEGLLQHARPRPLPASFTLVTHNPASSSSKGGFFIRALRRPFQAASIEVRKEASVWRVYTRNVERFALKRVPHILTEDMLPHDGMLIDGDAASSLTREQLLRLLAFDQAERASPTGAGMDICRREGTGSWTLCKWSASSEGAHRVPGSHGPVRQVYARPFVLVVGTLGNATVSADLLRLATFIANTHAMSSETHARIIRDVDVAALTDAPNLILVGGPSANSLTRDLYSRPDAVQPVRFISDQTGATVGYSITGSDCSYAHSSGLGIMFLTPLPRSYSPVSPALALVLDGVDSLARRGLLLLAEPTIPPMVRAPFSNILPDYLIVDAASLRWQGLGGLRAAGYFGPNWALHQARSYETC